jgi:hypothetical protein
MVGNTTLDSDYISQAEEVLYWKPCSYPVSGRKADAMLICAVSKTTYSG